ncbi:hypothetical protein MP228_008427 [Amoeboaphelidium protococcarum]|nr:hypothetical protein MP228_008427 [Amoeboaphelidium protococcarum]
MMMKINVFDFVKYSRQHDNIDVEGWLWFKQNGLYHHDQEDTVTDTRSRTFKRQSMQSNNSGSVENVSCSQSGSSPAGKLSDYKRRWFVLKGNLLFYFRYKSSSTPIGCILIEGMDCVRSSDSQPEYHEFQLISRCDADSLESPVSPSVTTSSLAEGESYMKARPCIPNSYHFVAASANECNSWMTAILNAPLKAVRQTMNSLVARDKECQRLLNDCMATLQQFRLNQQTPNEDSLADQEKVDGIVSKMKSVFERDNQSSVGKISIGGSTSTRSRGSENSSLAASLPSQMGSQFAFRPVSPVLSEIKRQEEAFRSAMNRPIALPTSASPSCSALSQSAKSPSLLTLQLRTPPLSRKTSLESLPSSHVPNKAQSDDAVYRPITSGSYDGKSGSALMKRSTLSGIRLSSGRMHRQSAPSNVRSDKQVVSSHSKLKEVTTKQSLIDVQSLEDVRQVLLTFTVDLQNGYISDLLKKLNSGQSGHLKTAVNWLSRQIPFQVSKDQILHDLIDIENESDFQNIQSDINIAVVIYEKNESVQSSLYKQLTTSNFSFLKIGQSEIAQVKDGRHAEFIVPIQLKMDAGREYRIEIQSLNSSSSASQLKALAFVDVSLKQLLSSQSLDGKIRRQSARSSMDYKLNTCSMNVFASEGIADLYQSLNIQQKINAGDIVGQLFVNVYKNLHVPSPDSILPLAIETPQQTQIYLVPTKNHQLLQINEQLVESPYSLMIAHEFARFKYDQESRIIYALTNPGLGLDSAMLTVLSNGSSSKEFRQNVLDKVIAVHQILLKFYQHALDSLTERLSDGGNVGKDYLRKSTDKKNEQLQWVTLNCNDHSIQADLLDDMDLSADSKAQSVITSGAFAAHAMGYSMSKQTSGNVFNGSDMLRLCHFERDKLQLDVSNDGLRSTVDKEKKLRTKLASTLNTYINLDRQSSQRPQLYHNVWEHLQDWVQLIMDALSRKYVDQSAYDGFPHQDQLRNGLFELTRQKEKILTRVIPLVTERLKVLVDAKNDQQAENIAAFSQSLTFAGQNFRRFSEIAAFAIYELVLVQEYQAINAILCEDMLRQKGTVFNADLICKQRIRQEICQSQAVGALLTGFIGLISQHYHDEQFWLNLESFGFLAHFESLLSACNDEKVMLNDTQQAVKSLSAIQFCFHQFNSDINGDQAKFKFTHNAGKLLLSIGVSQQILINIPENIRIKVVPLLFAQGVNEQQILANISGDNSIQTQINANSCAVLSQYMDQWRTCASNKQTELADSLMHKLKISIGVEIGNQQSDSRRSVKKLKNSANVLLLASNLTRYMSSVTPVVSHFISCKSGKDRTAMAVTLNHVLSISGKGSKSLRSASDISSSISSIDSAGVYNVDLHPEYFYPLLNAMRTESGLRLYNVERNFSLDQEATYERGCRGKYALNSIQLQILPHLYRPPPRVTNANVST